MDDILRILETMSLRDVCSKKESSIVTKGDVLEKDVWHLLFPLVTQPQLIRKLEKSAKVGDHD